MQQKSVEKNYIYNLIYQILVVAVPIITTPYVSRVLNADGVGAYSYTSAIAGYFALFANLGISTYGQLRVAGLRDNKRELSKIFFELNILRLILTVFVTAIYFIYVNYIAKESLRTLYNVLIIYILSNLFDISWLLQGLEEFKKIVIRNLIIKLLSVVLILLLVRQKNDLVLYAVIMNGSTLIGNLSLWFYVPQYIEKIQLKNLRVFSHLKACIVYFIPTVATTIYLTLDKAMIGALTTTSYENGYYEQAEKIQQMVVTIVTSLSIVTMPRMAYLFSQNRIDQLKDRFNQTIKFIYMLSFPMCFGLLGISNYFIPLFLGNGFTKSIILLKIFSFMIVIVGLDNAVGKQILMPIGRQKQYNIGVLTGAAVNFCLNAILIPKTYSIGAAVASVIAELCILCLFVFFSRDYIDVKGFFSYGVHYLIASLVMLAFIMASYKILKMNWISVAIQIVGGAIVYFLLLFAMREDFLLKMITKGKKAIRARAKK
jgi:O-antigen/teichoic acid export membrane protein